MILLTPALDRLESYANALRRGWSPDNLRAEVAVESLAAIERDPDLMAAHANAAAALSTLGYGAVPPLPTRDQTLAALAKR